MTLEDLFNLIKLIVNGQKAYELSLSKGGWEGWLQCELWYLLNQNDISSERELPYPPPHGKKRCDLVISDQVNKWVEIKAYGVFRDKSVEDFITAIAADVDKLIHDRPQNTNGISLVVVPKAISHKFLEAITRRWNNFKFVEYQYVYVFYILV
ncbi:MAG: hypothetical protein ABGX00_09145 [Allomuricauda sp.]